MILNFFGPTDRSKINRIMTGNLVFPVVRQHFSVLLKVVPTGKIEMIKLQIKAEFARRSVHDTNALGHHFLANTIAGDDGDSFSAHKRLHFTWPAPEFQAGPFAGNRPSTRPSSRPQSRSTRHPKDGCQ